MMTMMQQQAMAGANTFLSTIGMRILELSRWAREVDGSSSLSASERPLPSTLRDDLDALGRTMRRIEAVLCDAEEREITDVSVHLWLRELRGIAYDSDGVLDEYDYELLRAKAEDQERPQLPSDPDKKQRAAGQQVGGSTTMATTRLPLNKDVLFWGRVAETIRSIRQRFDEIAGERCALQLKEEDGQKVRRNFADRPPTSSTSDVPEDHIQGREADLDRLINGLLLSQECSRNDVTVIPVVGMAGVGKTTLVQHVYNNPGVCERFKLRGWVCVSDDFDVVTLTKKIIESLSSTPCELTVLDPLHQRLKNLLEEKRFLLVLDDVWNENRSLWDTLQLPLHYGGKGSAVITTTRSADIAKFMQTVPYHPLECLSDEHCWEIFRRFAFRGIDPRRDIEQELVVIGKKIVEKCKGLPLAAKALGSMLYYKTDVDSWDDVLQSKIWEFHFQDCGILPALMLSYAHLPPYLKRCFVYCSLFPKDFRFHKDELVLLWMAQGFIRCERRKQVEDIGATYVDELMQRSFFQYCDSKNSSVFVMHDLIHDLAQYNSKDEYHRVEKELSFDNSCYTRHLSISSMIYDAETVLQSYTATGNLRTLHLFTVNGMGGLPSMQMSNLKGLRTLVLSGQRIRELPDSIGELKHLRFLDLSGTDIAKLPDTLCNLYFLQTLLLRRCRNLESLPEVILKLSNLRCLEFSRYL